MARKKINDLQRTFIVKQLACYVGTTETAAATREEFGIEITKQAVERYHPELKAGQRLAPKWKDLFAQTRAAFLKHIEDHVPEAHMAVRVQKLAKASRAFEGARNYLAMASMLEKIAREVGGAFTNRREVSGPAGKPVQLQDVNTMSPEQVEAELRAYMHDPAVRAFVLGFATDDQPTQVPKRPSKQ